MILFRPQHPNTYRINIFFHVHYFFGTALLLALLRRTSPKPKQKLHLKTGKNFSDGFTNSNGK